MAEVLTNRAQTTLAAAITSAAIVITRPSATTGFPGDTNGPPIGNFRVVVTDGTNYELMLVTAGQGTTSLTVTRAVELIGGVQRPLVPPQFSVVSPCYVACPERGILDGLGETV